MGYVFSMLNSNDYQADASTRSDGVGRMILNAIDPLLLEAPTTSKKHVPHSDSRV
jgi:hypothetical protein